MRKKGDDQFSLDLSTCTTPKLPSVSDMPKVGLSETPAYPQADVISFTEKKAERDRGELNRHYLEILNLVRHFN